MTIPDTYWLHLFLTQTSLSRSELFSIYERWGNWQEGWQQHLPGSGLNESREQQKLEQLKIQLVSYNDSEYPELLREIPDFPLLLYYRGTLPESSSASLGVVGTRRITTYGRSVTSTLVPILSRSGLIIVSGLAYGVDALAHELALDNQQTTIAILGSGLDESSIYPADHIFLATKIIEQGGAIISEYPPGTPALRHHFLARNRIIAGMTLGTLVTECALKSGALITARHALDYNRCVYAVPGPTYSPMSEGTNWLLKQGARIVTEASDVLSDLNFIITSPPSATTAYGLNEQRVLECMHLAPQSVDSLVIQTQLPTNTVSSILTVLEMNGTIKHLGNSLYQKT
jgi:DNA processing protein